MFTAGRDSSYALLVTYRYNGLKHRVRKLLGASADTPTMAIDYYYNSDWQVIEERLALNSSAVGSPRMQYLWDQRYIDAPVCRWLDLNGFTGTVGGGDPVGDGDCEVALYYCNDANMNITALVNTAGAVLERYVYSPYGQVSFRQADWTETADGPDANTLPGDESAVFNTILYCGYRYDAEANHYHVRHRVYRPDVGRWWQRDPEGYVDGMDLYQCVRNSPPNAVDPWGLEYQILNGPYGPRWSKQGNVCEVFFTIDYAPSWYDYIRPWPLSYTPTPSTERSYPLQGLQECECTKQKIAEMAKAEDPMIATVEILIAQATGVRNALNIGYNNAGVTAEGMAMVAVGMVGGGVTQIIREGNLTISFGHGARHLEGSGLSSNAVNGAIAQDISKSVRGAASTGEFWGRTTVGGQVIEYRAYTLPGGAINVGTYYPK